MNDFNTHQPAETFDRNFTPFHTRILGAIPSYRPSPSFRGPCHRNLLNFSGIEDDLASSVVPPVTVVLEGRSICHRISLHKHASYQSLARALRQMFVDVNCDVGLPSDASYLDLSNAVPGHLVAYEDMEDDLLLAGDLNWKDFVRVVKRIRILPVKASPRKDCSQM